MNNNRQGPTPPPGLSLGEVYYIIFRHKWKIILTSVAGLLAAAIIHHAKMPLYESQAELLVKYVPGPNPWVPQGDNRVIVPDSDGEDVINSEIKILTSWDVAELAASNIGPSTVLAKMGGPASALRAAAFIHGNLDAEPADERSSVIIVTLKHPDPRVVQPLLESVINAYLQKDYDIHSAGGQVEEALMMEQSELNVRLTATEQQLADLKNKYHIINLDDSQTALNAQLSTVRADILNAQADLSADEAAMKQTSGRQSFDLTATNRLPATIPQNEIDAYADICASLNSFRKREQDYLVEAFTGSNTLLENVKEQIATREMEKDALERKYPQIAALAPIPSFSSGAPGVDVATDPRTQLAQIVALKAKTQAWQAQLANLQTQATNLNNLAPAMAQLQQTESILKANYQNLSESLESSHIEESLDPRKSPAIRLVQDPSPPSQDWKKTYKTMGMAAMAGILGGLAWAFMMEMVLDRSVKRPVEVERRLKLPLFVSIPNVNQNGYTGLARTVERLRLTFNGRGPAGPEIAKSQSSAQNGNGHVVSWEQNPLLQPFHQALRERLILYFEVKGFTHKPKFVALTGAGRAAGVSTIASGLAASLSETGEGNVLLVDMNLENGAARQFYKGRACCGLDTVLADETKKNALVQRNLYVVNGNTSDEGLCEALPKRFTTLVPRLKASDYDYIIFDMPVVSPASVTSHLARFMDITLLVIESEKTGREIAEQSSAWLTEVGATVGVVLNKTWQYVPKQLQEEFLNEK